MPGYLDINAPAPNPEKQEIETGQSPEEQEVVKMVLAFYEEGKKTREDVSKEWEGRYDSFNDKQWDPLRPRYKSSPVLNVGRAAIQTVVPILTDAKPKFNPEPMDPSDYDFADTLSKSIDFWWDRNAVQTEVVSALYDSNIIGTGMFKITWDEDAADGEGDVLLRATDPKAIYVPKGATDFNHRTCLWVIETQEKRVGELKRMFPDKAHLIRPDGGVFEEGTAKQASFSKEVKLVSPVDSDQRVTPVTQSIPGHDNLTVNYAECWMVDDSVEEYVLEHEQEDGSKRLEKILKKKYPKGRLVSLLMNSKVLLQDVENPYRDGKQPYVRLVNTIQPRKFWGDGIIGS